MALKRRAKVDHAAEIAAWSMTFRHGHDYLRALPAIGVPITKALQARRNAADPGRRPATPPGHLPPRHLLKEAWHRLGREFLDDRGCEAEETWAERTLGQPEDVQPTGGDIPAAT